MTIANGLERAETINGLNVSLLGRRITCISAGAIVAEIERACIENRKIVVANYNVHIFNLSMQLPWFYEFLQTADIAHCDGAGILKAIRWVSGIALPRHYRVSYSTLMPLLLEQCNKQAFSLFLLGSEQETLQQALEQLGRDYPRIRLAGHHGYFSLDDFECNEAIVEQINLVKPNILLVGMGNPRQEAWIQKNRHRLNVNVMMPGGAVIDRLAGVVPDCPRFVSNLGLEWMYRLFREPRRLAIRYLLGNPAFVLHIFLAKYMAPSTEVVSLKPMRSLP